jgi:hypothetical protein
VKDAYEKIPHRHRLSAYDRLFSRSWGGGTAPPQKTSYI